MWRASWTHTCLLQRNKPHIEVTEKMGRAERSPPLVTQFPPATSVSLLGKKTLTPPAKSCANRLHTYNRYSFVQEFSLMPYDVLIVQGLLCWLRIYPSLR